MKIVCHDELKYKNKITNPISAEALHIVCIEELEINKKKEKKLASLRLTMVVGLCFYTTRIQQERLLPTKN